MSRPHTMTSRHPATRWQDALPSGNGSIGALVYGHIRHELILLNHEALWLPGPRPTLPDISMHLPELRALLAAGKYRQAADFLEQKIKEHGGQLHRPAPYHPAGDLALEMVTPGAFRRYRRSVDFETGQVTVSWESEGVAYTRELFVSRADDVVALRLRASRPGAITCRFALIPHDLQFASGMGSGHTVKGEEVPITFEPAAEEGWLRLRGVYAQGGGFGLLGRVLAKGGTLAVDKDALWVRGADEALVLVKLSANQAAFPRLRGEMEDLCATYPELLSGAGYGGYVSYEALLQRHVALHRPLYLRMTLDLDAGAERGLANEELLLAAYDGDVPTALIERLFDYGRYLLLCSSRAGGLPANLQGVWNGDYFPAWASDYHNDENIQMNYWQALSGNMPEVALPYFDYYASMLEDYRLNARNVYGCRGILAPIAQSTHGIVHPGVWSNWTAGAGWLAQLFYDYWLFTGDREFLARRVVPFLREVALFYEDFLIEDAHGRFLFSPSLSPENVPAIPEGSLVALNATMDVAIAKEVLHNLCTACETLGMAAEDVARWRGMMAKLPPYQVNRDGALKEWLHPDLPDNYHHRHQSHLYPLFPGFEITEEDAPSLFAACRVAVEKRLVIGLTSQTGWSLAHMANIYARLGDGERALECLELLSRACVGPNLFTYHNDWRSQGLTMFWGHRNHPPFQIDANLGLAAAVLEMLVFSRPGMIKLLPALPKRWAVGRAEGILCRGGIEVSLEWDMPQGKLQVALRAHEAQRILAKFPGAVRALTGDLPPDAVSAAPQGPAYRWLTLPAGPTRLEVSLARS